MAFENKKAPYVPWMCEFTLEAAQKLRQHFSCDDIDAAVDNHCVRVGNDQAEFFTDLGEGRVEDIFKVVWDRSIDKDIGVVEGCVLPEPTLKGYDLPDPLADRVFADIDEKLAKYSDCFRVFPVHFSLYERAWTLRGMENLMMDFIENPGFAHELLAAIADYNITQIKEAAKYDIDAVHFGDDWGQQRGLQMGPAIWGEFIYPQLKRTYQAVHDAGKYVKIHSCGKVDELFDDLIDIGLDCFNPFQPEVMDCFSLMKKYKGRLAFHGGMSTQQTLPYGSVADVRAETAKLLAAGADGGYIFVPAHAVEGDVPLENMLAFIELLHDQPNYKRSISPA